MWQEENGVFEMFLAYYSQFEDNLKERKTYRDFLLEVLYAHERSLTWTSNDTQQDLVHEPSFHTENDAPSIEMPCSDASVLEKSLSEFYLRHQSLSGGVKFEVPSEMSTSVKVEVDEFSGEWQHQQKIEDDELKTDEPSISASEDMSQTNFVCESDERLNLNFLPPTISHVSRNSSAPDELSAQRIPPRSLRRADGRYECDQCGRSFSCSSNLRKHERVHRSERPYECPFCDKSFRFASCRRKHVSIHTGERPFRCQLCPKSFVAPSQLRVHEVTHTNERAEMCDLCGKRFRHRSSMQSHRLTHQRQSSDNPVN